MATIDYTKRIHSAGEGGLDIDLMMVRSHQGIGLKEGISIAPRAQIRLVEVPLGHEETC